MRKVSRDYEKKPRSLEGKAFEKEWNKVAKREEKKIKSSIYSDPYYDSYGNTASRVIDVLNECYYYKCGYCERRYKLDVEHYRPKGEVRDLNNEIIKVKNSVGKLIAHPGYYWLGYEWSNLIPACISCNRDGGKNSKFPNLNGYLVEPPMKDNVLETDKCKLDFNDLKNEKPMMIHPEEDNIGAMFQFEIDKDKKGIEIIGNDAEGRGEATILICQMNRTEIRMDRLEYVIQPLDKAFRAIFKRLEAGRITNIQFKSEMEGVIQKLYDDIEDETLTHTCLRKCIIESVENFKSIVLPFVMNSLRDVVLEVFVNYRPV